MFITLFCTVVAVVLLSPPCVRSNDVICPTYPPISDINISSLAHVLAQVNDFIEQTIMDENQITGFITSIVYDQHLLFSKGYGFKNYLNVSLGAPDGDDLVMIASNTKLFTALLTYYLRDASPHHSLNYNNVSVSLNDAITKYLPSFSIRSIYDDSHSVITLNELLSHTSGLQDETPYPFGDVSDNETAILQALSTRYLIAPSYSTFHYSNLGFALLGRAMEKVFCPMTGGCYEEYTKQLILNGLNFSQYSGFNYSDEIVNNYCAVGWYIDSDGNRKQAPIESYHWDSPNGAMLASSNDMAKYMSFIFRDNLTTSQHPYQLLNGSTIREMLKPKILLNDGLEAIAMPFEMHYNPFKTLHPYGNENRVSGVWVKGKAGEVLGYRSSTMMIPEYKLGVFTVALEDPEYISEGSVWANNILNMILPVLDNILYQNFVDNNVKYFIPANSQLLSGQYLYTPVDNNNTTANTHSARSARCHAHGHRNKKGFSSSSAQYINIALATDAKKGHKQYLSYRDGSSDYNFRIFKDGITDVYRLGNDMHTQFSTCFWTDLVNELLYFDFSNGVNNHAVSFLFDEELYVYQH